MDKGNVLLTKAVVKDAIDFVVAGIIIPAMNTGLVHRQHLSIIAGNINGDVLGIRDIGRDSGWEHPYDEIAKSKFDITARTGKPTQVIQELEPELAGFPGDTVYWGSWIDGGIIVACSGVRPWYDLAFSKCIVALIRANIIEKRQAMLGKLGKVDFY